MNILARIGGFLKTYEEQYGTNGICTNRQAQKKLDQVIRQNEKIIELLESINNKPK